MCIGSSSTALDSMQAGSSSSVRSFMRLEFLISVCNQIAVASASSIFGCINCSSSTSMRSFVRSRSSPPAFGRVKFGPSVSGVDSVHTDSLSSSRSSSRLESPPPSYGFRVQALPSQSGTTVPWFRRSYCADLCALVRCCLLLVNRISTACCFS